MEEYTGDDTALMNDLGTPVVGTGFVDAELFIIGDFPTAEEAEEGRAFRSVLGKCLLYYLEQDVGIPRKTCWFTYVVKTKPEAKRWPTYEEVEEQLPYLLREIAIVRPKIIVCLGDISTTLAMHGFQLEDSLRGAATSVIYASDAHALFRSSKFRVLKAQGKTVSAVRFGKRELVCRLFAFPSVSELIQTKPYNKVWTEQTAQSKLIANRTENKRWVEYLLEWQLIAKTLALPAIPYIAADALLMKHYESKGIESLDDAAGHFDVEFSTPSQVFVDRTALYHYPLSEDYIDEHIAAKKGIRICVQMAHFVESQNEFRIFCRTYEGYSVLLHVREPKFEFWVSHGSLNPIVNAEGIVDFRLLPIQTIEDHVRRWLISALEGTWRYEDIDEDRLWDLLGVTVEYSWNRSAFFYQPVRTRHIYITFKRYDILWTLKSAMNYMYPECEFFETKVGPVEQLFFRQNIYSYGWLRLDPNVLKRIEQPESICDFEFACDADKIAGKNPNTGQAKSSIDQWMSVVRFGALDGEMLNQGSGAMPIPESDPVVCLCLYISDTNAPMRPSLFEVQRSPKKPQDVYVTGRTNYVDALAFVVGPHQPLVADPFHPKYLPYAPLLPKATPGKFCIQPTVDFLRDIFNWELFLDQYRNWIGYVGTHRARIMLRSAKLQRLMLEPEYTDWPETYQDWRRRMKAIFATWHTRLPDAEIEADSTQPPATCEVASELGSIQANWRAFHPEKRVFFFRNEEEMLAGFVECIRQADLDCFSGHNVSSFDLTYLIRRIQVLGIRWDWYWDDRGSALISLGKGYFTERNRVTSLTTDSIQTKTQETRASGVRVFTLINIPGRDIFDTLHYAQKDIPGLDGYTLSQVAKKAVGDVKHDVPWSAIPSLFLNLPKKLTDYCMQDTELCERIMNALNTMNYVISMCRIIGCMSIGEFYTTGVQKKILLLQLRWLKSSGLAKIFPDFNPFSQSDKEEVEIIEDEELDEEAEKQSKKKGRPSAGYTGATVLEVIRGFFRIPIPTLDFSALYPSIMDEVNLSLNTMGFLNHFQSLGIDISRLYTSGEKHRNPFRVGEPEPLYFLQRRKLTKTEAEALPEFDDQPAGIAQCMFNPEDKTWTPKLELGDLVATGRMCRDARTAIRKEQDQYPSSHPRYKVLDSQQIAVKVLANSHYGYTGVASGRGACMPLGATVTHRGRMMIENVKAEMEKHFNATVVGGDTDSVFLMFPGQILELEDLLKPTTRHKNVEDPNSPLVTLPFIEHCVNHINARVGYPHKIVFEKAGVTTGSYAKKKQDAAICMPVRDPITGKLTFENSGVPKMSCKGTEGKRRSTAPYAKQILDKFVEILWTDPKADIEVLKRKAEAYVREKVQQMRAGNYDYSQMILSRYFARQEKDYADPNAPVLMINKKKRERGEEPFALGTRIPMVVVDVGRPKAKFGEKVEIPDYALEHKLPLDIEYYIDKHLKQPLKRKTDVIDPSMLQRMFPPPPKRMPRLNTNDPLSGFVYVHNKCLVCTASCDQGHVCDTCIAERPPDEIMDTIVAKEVESAQKLDTQKAICYACMGMDEPGEIVCANAHCKEYPVRKDMEFSLKHKLQDGKELREQWGIFDW